MVQPRDDVATLEALTPEAERSLRAPSLVIERFPFRVGREMRTGIAGPYPGRERRRLNHAPNNDLYLPDGGPGMNVSREHFQIELLPDESGFRVVDRGSACGTIVGNTTVGGADRGGCHPLEDGNVIVVGTSKSPFVFRFRLRGRPRRG